MDEPEFGYVPQVIDAEGRIWVKSDFGWNWQHEVDDGFGGTYVETITVYWPALVALASPLALAIAPAGLVSEEAHGDSLTTAGGVGVSPAGLASEEAHGTSVVT